MPVSNPHRRTSNRGRILALAAAATLGLAAFRAIPDLAPAAPGAQAATLSYTIGGRKMVYVNNPERLLSTDLAHSIISGTTQGPSLLTVSLAAGTYRDYFEHLNATGGSVAFGVYIHNPTSKKVVVVRRRKGFAAGDYQIGAKPFVQMFSSTEAAQLTLDPAVTRGGWIFRSDLVYGSAGSALDGQFLTGAFDFDITVEGGTDTDKVIVHHLVYDPARFSSLPGSYSYIGYVTRTRPSGDPEHRTYKGVSAGSEADASLSVTIGSATGPGALPVSYSRYGVVNSTTGEYGPVSTHTGTLWYTHDTPARDKTDSFVAAADMLAFDMPGHGVVHPLTKSSYGGQYPNLGNWGVLYRNRVTVSNNSGRTRTVAVHVGVYDSTDSDNAFVAVLGNDGRWTGVTVRDGASVAYRTVAVPAGTSTFTTEAVLGAPSDGRLFHRLVLLD